VVQTWCINSATKLFWHFQPNKLYLCEVLDNIFKELLQQKQIDAYLKKKQCRNIEDVKQQAILNLLERGEPFILDLNQRKKINAYFVVSCLNISISQNKGVKFVSVVDVLDLQASGEYEEINIDFEALERVEWYKTNVAKKYLEFGSLQKLSNFTEIPYKSLQKTVSLTKKIIKENGDKYIKRTSTGLL
jgi:HD superfamily phosphohydrolase